MYTDCINKLDKVILDLTRQRQTAREYMDMYEGVDSVGYLMAKQAYKDATAERAKACALAHELENIQNSINSLRNEYGDMMSRYGVDI